MMDVIDATDLPAVTVGVGERGAAVVIFGGGSLPPEAAVQFASRIFAVAREAANSPPAAGTA